MDSSLYKIKLIDLQDIDLKIDKLLNEKMNADTVQSLKHLEEEYKELVKNLSDIDESLLPYNEKLKEYESLLEKQKLSKETNLKSQSDTNVPSELTNYILQEQEIKNNIDSLDKEANALVEEYKGPLNDKAMIEVEISEIKEQLVLKSKEVLNYWESIDSKIQEINKERDGIINEIPSKYLDRYEFLRKSEKIVVGSVNEEQQCGICGFLLTSNELARIERGDDDQCPSCGGLLL